MAEEFRSQLAQFEKRFELKLTEEREARVLLQDRFERLQQRVGNVELWLALSKVSSTQQSSVAVVPNCR